MHARVSSRTACARAAGPRAGHNGPHGGAPRVRQPGHCGGGAFCANCLRICDETIRRVGHVFALPASDLDDFIQDAWLGILTALAGGHYKPHRGRLADWLFVLARNRAVGLFRRRLRAERGVVAMPLELLPGRSASDPAAILDRQGDIEHVRRAVQLLKERASPTGYAVFHLRRIQQLSVSEVAQRLRLTRPQVRVLDHRACRKLAAILRPPRCA